MNYREDLSLQAAKLVVFFDDQGFPSISELVVYLDTDEHGKQIRRVGTSVFGIRHQFEDEMSQDERMFIYATFSNPLYLGSISGPRRPLDSLELLMKHFADGTPEGKKEFDYFALELLSALTNRKEPEIGMAFSVVY